MTHRTTTLSIALFLSMLATPAALFGAGSVHTRALVLVEGPPPTLEQLHGARDRLSAAGLRVTGILPPRVLIAHGDEGTFERVATESGFTVHTDGVPIRTASRYAAVTQRSIRAWNLHRKKSGARRPAMVQDEVCGPLRFEWPESLLELEVRERSYVEHWAAVGEEWTRDARQKQGLRVLTSGERQAMSAVSGPGVSTGTGLFDTSLFFCGDVSVGVFFVPSQTETWTQLEMDAFVADIVTGCDQFVLDEPNAGLTFTYVVEGMVPVPEDRRTYVNDLRNAFGTH